MKSLRVFLSALFNSYLETHKGFIEIRTISPIGKVQSYFFNNLNTLLEQIPKFKGNHIYFGVNPRNSQKSGKKDNISFTTVLFSDIDFGSIGHLKPSKYKTEAEALKAINDFEFPPSIVVNSGGGFHSYWLLREATKIEDLKYIEGIIKGITEYLGGDAGTQNIDRILRLPGTDNIKIPNKPRETRILKFEPSLRYNISDLEGYKIDVDTMILSEVDLEGKPEKVNVGELPLKSDIRELIYLGNKINHKFPSRSERDQAVIGALVHTGLTNSQIKTIFSNPAYGISDKYLERQQYKDNYLGISIQKARASYEQWKKDHPKPDIDTVLGILRKSEFGYEMYTLGKNKKPSTWELVCNFTVNYNRVIKGEEKTNVIGTLRVEGEKVIPFIWDSKVPTNPQLLREELGRICPTGLKLMPQHIHRIGVAINANNENVREYIGIDSIGQNKNSFITPNYIIKEGKIEKNEKYYILNKNVSIYDFDLKPLEACKEATEFIIKDVLPFHSYNLTMPLLGEVGRTPLIHKISDLLYVTFFRGQTGHGKTIVQKVMLNFYADISVTTDKLQSQGIRNFRDTQNYVEKHGYHLVNLPMMLDDFKIGIYGANKMAIQVIQSYYNQSGRGRLTQKIEERNPFYLRCNLWVTGENLPTGEQSVLERIMIYQTNEREMDLAKLPIIEQKRGLLRIFTPHYISWVQKNGPQKFEAKVKHPRLGSYIRQNLTGLRSILSFMLDNKWIVRDQFDELMGRGIDASSLAYDYTEASSSSENIIESFLSDIRELVSSKSCIITLHEELLDDKRESYRPIIGEYSPDGERIYLYPQKAIQEACRQLHNSEKKYTARTLATDLKETGWLVETEKGRISVRKRLKHGSSSVWVFDKKRLMEENLIEIELKAKEVQAQVEAKKLLKEDKEKSTNGLF